MISCPAGRSEKTVTELYDLFTPECGELADVGLTLRKAKLHLEPAVCLFLVHQAAFPQPFERGVGVNALAAQGPVRQGAHGQIRVPVGGHIGIAGGKMRTDIVGGIGIDCVLTEENRGGTEKGAGSAVGTFDVDSFH